MNPLWILLIGITVVVGGILILRLHAFLALMFGALLVGLLTPTESVYRYTLRAGEIPIVGFDAQSQSVVLSSKSKLPEGSPLIVIRRDAQGKFQQIASLRITGQDANGHLLASLKSSDPFVYQSDDIAIDPTTDQAARKESSLKLGDRIAEGFSNTAKDVGILIAMASILGKALMESGAAERIVLSCRNALGEARASLAFLISSFALAALVLSDTTFYLLIPLAQVMRARSGKDYALYILAIVAGATMSHSLVPPAAGPAFVASELGVSLLTMMVGGVIVGSIASTAGYAYALWANRKWDIPLRATFGTSTQELEALANRDAATLPPLWLAILPIILPVALIAAGAVSDRAQSKSAILQYAAPILHAIGEKNMALTIAAAIGLLMMWFRRSKMGVEKKSSKSVGEALSNAGIMVLFISAGGAFGFLLRQTDIAASVKDLLPVSKLTLLPLAFLVASAARTAQGSAIVSMITAVAIVGPVAASGALGFHPVYLALAIGCGSKPIMWMNDAGFWIIGRTSGMTEAETLKTATVLMAIMGVVGLLATMAGAWIFPMSGV
jgi:GntP family gluconate:H+ symporter